MPRGLVIQFKEQQGQSRIPVLWKLISHSSVFEIVTMSYFWKFLWLGRKSFDWFYFLKSKKIVVNEFVYPSGLSRIGFVPWPSYFFYRPEQNFVKAIGLCFLVVKYWDKLWCICLYCWLFTPTNREIFGEYIVINVFLKTTNLLVRYPLWLTSCTIFFIAQ